MAIEPNKIEKVQNNYWKNIKLFFEIISLIGISFVSLLYSKRAKRIDKQDYNTNVIKSGLKNQARNKKIIQKKYCQFKNSLYLYNVSQSNEIGKKIENNYKNIATN